MKKAIALAAAAVMLLTLFTGCGKQPAEDNNTDKTTFTVGFDAEFPPYGYQDETGEYVGFDLDLAAGERRVVQRQHAHRLTGQRVNHGGGLFPGDSAVLPPHPRH